MEEVFVGRGFVLLTRDIRWVLYSNNNNDTVCYYHPPDVWRGPRMITKFVGGGCDNINVLLRICLPLGLSDHVCLAEMEYLRRR